MWSAEGTALEAVSEPTDEPPPSPAPPAPEPALPPPPPLRGLRQQFLQQIAGDELTGFQATSSNVDPRPAEVFFSPRNAPEASSGLLLATQCPGSP